MKHIKMYDLRCEFCGKPMRASRPDAKYHGRCRGAAWRLRHWEEKKAGQQGGAQGREVDNIFRSLNIEPPARRDEPAPAPASSPTYSGMATWMGNKNLADYERVIKYDGTPWHVRPLLDAKKMWAPAVDGKRWYCLVADPGKKIELPCPKDPILARRFRE